MNTTDIIERLGGPAQTARICGVSRPAVTLWKSRGIPPGHWQTLVRYAEDGRIPGVTYDTIQAARHGRGGIGGTDST